jgi:hypothetical protein
VGNITKPVSSLRERRCGHIRDGTARRRRHAAEQEQV